MVEGEERKGGEAERMIGHRLLDSGQIVEPIDQRQL